MKMRIGEMDHSDGISAKLRAADSPVNSWLIASLLTD